MWGLGSEACVGPGHIFPDGGGAPTKKTQTTNPIILGCTCVSSEENANSSNAINNTKNDSKKRAASKNKKYR